MIGGELWVGLGVGVFWVGRAVLESCVRGWRCSCLVIVIACGMWNGVTQWIGLACLWAQLVVGSGLGVVASLRSARPVVVGLVGLVVLIGFYWEVCATFLQHQCRGCSPRVS